MILNITRITLVKREILAFLLFCLFGVANSLQAEPVRILLFGDSFAAGYGLPEADGFSSQLQEQLREEGVDAEVINAGVSGDTSYSALARADVTLQIPHDVMVLEIGANDMLRGVPPANTKANLGQIIAKSDKPVYVLGMLSMPNLGLNYTRKFDQIYGELAKEYGAGLYPFLMEPIFQKGLRNALLYFQPDYLHPNAKGVFEISSHVAPELANWLQENNLLEGEVLAQ